MCVCVCVCVCVRGRDKEKESEWGRHWGWWENRGKRSFRVKKKKKNTIRDSFPCELKSVLLTSSPGFRAFEVYFQDLAITPFSFCCCCSKVSSTHSYFLAIFLRRCTLVPSVDGNSFQALTVGKPRRHGLKNESKCSPNLFWGCVRCVRWTGYQRCTNLQERNLWHCLHNDQVFVISAAISLNFQEEENIGHLRCFDGCRWLALSVLSASLAEVEGRVQDTIWRGAVLKWFMKLKKLPGGPRLWSQWPQFKSVFQERVFGNETRYFFAKHVFRTFRIVFWFLARRWARPVVLIHQLMGNQRS